MTDFDAIYTACTFIYYFPILQLVKSLPFYLRPKKGTLFGRSVPVQDIIESTPGNDKTTLVKTLERRTQVVARQNDAFPLTSPPSPSHPLPAVHSCINTINIAWGEGDSRNRLLCVATFPNSFKR